MVQVPVTYEAITSVIASTNILQQTTDQPAYMAIPPHNFLASVAVLIIQL